MKRAFCTAALFTAALAAAPSAMAQPSALLAKNSVSRPRFSPAGRA